MLPNAPRDADSVGVAIPANIEPNTNTMRVSGGIIDKRAFLIFTPLLASSFTLTGGAISLLKKATTSI